MYYRYSADDFWLSVGVTEEKATQYVLHNHENVCEILFFLQGNSSFVVEGSEYPLSFEDFIIARHDEMHRVVHNAPCTYERVIINFDKSFFENNGCEEYAAAFFDRPAGSGNLFRAESSRRAVDALHRLTLYIKEKAPKTLVRGVLCEVLRCISKREEATEGTASSERLREIILYLNENLSGDLSLEAISSKFFISKYHLCRLFKTQTGMTLGQYVTAKRLLKADELHSSGMSLTDAAVAAGFNDYSAYWHASRKQNVKKVLEKN